MWIGVTGFAQHGKDTVANLLCREYGFTRIAFADALKSMAITLNPFVQVDEYGGIRLKELVEHGGWEQAKTNMEVRRFLQVLGTEAVRAHLGDESWVDALFKQAQNIENLVIPDVRFPNEGDFIEKEGVLLAVQRLNPDFTPFDNGIGVSHPSEAYVPTLVAKADALFIATNTEELEEGVRAWMADRKREGAIR